MKYILLLLILPVSLAAFDFGLTTSQYGGISNNNVNDDILFEYNGNILPRFSMFFGETGNIFASAALTFNYNNNEDDFNFIPELLRTEVSYRFGQIGVKAGRMNYADPLGFIANGLFDGFQIIHTSPLGRFGFGAWYTGLLYKNNINIGMTAEERERNSEPLDYDDFADTYFSSSKRLLAAVDWEHPSVAETLRLRSTLIAQFDLRDTDEYKINTQYLAIKASMPFNSFNFEAGGSFQLAQTDLKENDIFSAFAWSLGVFWTMPTSFHSRLAFTADFASGKENKNIGAFVPITSSHRNSGGIFQPILTNLTVLSLNYTARIMETLGASFDASYYIRNNHLSGNNFYVDPEKNDKHLLGQEFFTNVIWSPYSDLQLNLGAGIFLPALGNVWDFKPQWKVELTAVLALF